MECRSARNLLDAFADQELDLASSRQIEDHLEICPACQRQLEAIGAIRTGIANPALYHTAPQSLRMDLERMIGQAPRAHPALRWGWVAAAACLLLTMGFLWSSSRWALDQSNRQVAEVLSDHLRSLQAEHLMDVPSTDQHTVKPWFAGRLDFSPPVHDLKADGFPLVGGRLDYLQGRPVAGLVFHHRKHIINLLVLPGDSTDLTITQQGYNIVRFTSAGMTMWAVSDMAMDDLKHFAQLYQNPPKEMETAASQPAGASVTIDNFHFTPAELDITAGTTVTWTNNDDVPHTATNVGDNPLFDSGPIDTDEKFTFTFTKPGTYAYYCKVHPHMKGTIVVK
jgi:anti-sigma factor RsiW